ncbi:hypothetical protein ACYSNW_15010 [Enterococcus sp. LJL99]
MNKKKVGLICLISIITLLLVSCRMIAKFNGSRTGNDDHFIMNYKVLNIEDSQELTLKKADKVICEIDNEAGEITITITHVGKDELIKKNYKREKDQFTFEVPNDGKYTISVSGNKAKGKVSFVRE